MVTQIFACFNEKVTITATKENCITQNKTVSLSALAKKERVFSYNIRWIIKPLLLYHELQRK